MKFKLIKFSIIGLFLLGGHGLAQKNVDPKKTKEIVQNAAFEINKQLASDNLGEALGKEIEDSNILLSFLKKDSLKTAKLQKTITNIKHVGFLYKDQPIEEYLNKAVSDYAKFTYDKDKIKSIIDDAEKEVEKLSASADKKVNKENSPTKKDKPKLEVKRPPTKSKEIELLTKQIEEISNSRSPSLALYALIIAQFLVIIYLIYLIMGKKRRKVENPTTDTLDKPIERNVASTASPINVVAKQQTPPSPKDISTPKKVPSSKNSWLVVGASVIGKDHLKRSPIVPCQDSHHIELLDKGWGIAVCSDGAGSAIHSDWGSQFIVSKSCELFRQIIESSEAFKKQSLPKEDDWHGISIAAFGNLRTQLEAFASQKGVKAETMACTVIVVVFSQMGILVTHIGDGRAAYCNREGEWKSMITPWKGEEANQTVFLTSSIWNKPNDFIESRIISEKPVAFALMTDGCENHSFETYQGSVDAATQRPLDLNRPYPKFFGSLVNALKEMNKNQLGKVEIDAKWSKFVESGNAGLENEGDDKTLILGILVE